MIRILAPDGRCSRCRRRRPLEIGHLLGAEWDRRGLDSEHRVSLYEQEFLQGTPLAAECRSCNARDGRMRLQGRWNKINTQSVGGLR